MDSIIADAANAKGTLIVGNYDEVFGGYGGGSFIINTPGGGAGESDYGIPLAVITGIGAAGAAVAGAAAAAGGGGGNGGSETERTSTYRMRIRKDFEDYIVCGKSPETIYAQMIEITAGGREERDDLTTARRSSAAGSGRRPDVQAVTWERSTCGRERTAEEDVRWLTQKGRSLQQHPLPDNRRAEDQVPRAGGGDGPAAERPLR